MSGLGPGLEGVYVVYVHKTPVRGISPVVFVDVDIVGVGQHKPFARSSGSVLS